MRTEEELSGHRERIVAAARCFLSPEQQMEAAALRGLFVPHARFEVTRVDWRGWIRRGGARGEVGGGCFE